MDLKKLIKDLVKENNITAYEIAKNTSISVNTVRNILNDSKINTKAKTLNIILEYLENAIVGTKGQLEIKKKYTTEYRNKHVAETPINYQNDFSSLKIDDKLNILFNQQNETNEKLEVISEALLQLSLTFEDIKLQQTTK